MKNWIAIIGSQRFIKLIVLAALTAVFVMAALYYAKPQLTQAEKELKDTRNEVSRLTNDIADIPNKLKMMQENEDQYRLLVQRQFMSDQDRISIRRVIDDMRERSGVLSINYDISPLEKIDNNNTYALDHELIKSPVKISVTALIDLEIEAFKDMLNNQFPGFTVIKNIAYERTNPITQENLVKIGAGEPVPFVSADIEFDWYSLTKKPPVAEPSAF